MSTLAWIVASSLLMSAIALVGSVTLVLKESTRQRILLPLAAFAAGLAQSGVIKPLGVPSLGSGFRRETTALPDDNPSVVQALREHL